MTAFQGPHHEPDYDTSDVVTRTGALREGLLADVSETARAVGFVYAVAVTSAVWLDAVIPTELDRRRGENVENRLWRILTALRERAHEVEDADVVFELPLFMAGLERTVRLRAVVGAGDQAEPVITILLLRESYSY